MNQFVSKFSYYIIKFLKIWIIFIHTSWLISQIFFRRPSVGRQIYRIPMPKIPKNRYKIFRKVGMRYRYENFRKVGIGMAKIGRYTDFLVYQNYTAASQILVVKFVKIFYKSRSLFQKFCLRCYFLLLNHLRLMLISFKLIKA